jgi:LmbE family N-acetylglucosaminyl deacetylase
VRTALVLHAHPDDEVFATGAATIQLAEAGWRVVLRVASPGPDDRAIHGLQASCPLLGISDWDLFGPWVDDGGPQSVAAADITDVAEAISETLHAVQPELVLSVGTDGLTGHPDHLAISTALQLALHGSQLPALGARLRAADVRAGHQLLQQVLPGERVGSGRVQGTEAVLHEYAGEPAVAHRRRQALDQYFPGLGSEDLNTLVTKYRRRGDSLLLRAVFDAASWSYDHFEALNGNAQVSLCCSGGPLFR